MADARSLLRQQRIARRVEHPFAAYSESGKLSCSLCKELIRTESLWEGHIRGVGHLKRLEELQSEPHNAGDATAAEARRHPPKRKLDDAEDADMLAPGEGSMRKRNKANMTSLESSINVSFAKSPDDEPPVPAERTTPKLTPPLPRPTLGTPSQGMELRIPSRPATPLEGRFFDFSTPQTKPNGRSPVIPDEPVAGTAAEPLPTEAQQLPSVSELNGVNKPETQDVDEQEWAAFEAEMIRGMSDVKAPAPTNYVAADAVITAAPLSAEAVAAKSAEEEQAKRKALADIQIEDEGEDAARALELEFDEMAELEARAKRLRERREALRASDVNSAPVATNGTEQKENKVVLDAANAQEEVNDENDDTDDDDWDAFRFRR